MKFRVSEDRANLVVDEAFVYTWEYGGKEYVVRVPKGFKFKRGIYLRLGSVGLIDIFAPTFSLLLVSAVHDWVYHLQEEGEADDISRAAADEIIRSDQNDPSWVRQTAWFIVRLVGGTVW